eukprot:4093434-Pyramimonas_sp.AAC.1
MAGARPRPPSSKCALVFSPCRRSVSVRTVTLLTTTTPAERSSDECASWPGTSGNGYQSKLILHDPTN